MTYPSYNYHVGIVFITTDKSYLQFITLQVHQNLYQKVRI